MKAHKSPPPYDTIVFDCDSTLARIEGIEAIAAGDAALEDRIRTLTERAMRGEVALQDVYGARLELIRPTARQVLLLGEHYVRELLPNVRELVAALRFLQKRVCIVSGGLLQPVRAVATELGLPHEDVFAVGVRFDARDEYVGYDRDSPLARAGGKLEVLEGLSVGDARMALVGDGATDLEAATVCTRFIAFGGVVRRETVFEGADATCDLDDFAALAPLLLSLAELEQLDHSQDHSALARAARETSR